MPLDAATGGTTSSGRFHALSVAEACRPERRFTVSPDLTLLVMGFMPYVERFHPVSRVKMLQNVLSGVTNGAK